MDLTVHNTNICWNMLIKFSKQIGNNFAKIFNTKVHSKLCQTADMELFLLVVTGFRGQLRILPYIEDGAFCKNSQWSLVHYFCKNLHFECLTRL